MKNSLALLDDPICFSKETLSLMMFVRSKVLKTDSAAEIKPTPMAFPVQTKNIPPAPKKAAVQSNKLFSSSPTLRSMMHSYNRPRAKSSPIKKAVRPEFAFESFDLIEIPTIPGRVLRPTRRR